ncbi:MAG: peptidase U32 [Deltaproteobacteria bacterium]|nr:MAG: peptidase U32 [Deltaproteobacteria bacterium]
MHKRPELLAPAGNMEKLQIAVHYGADAVYLGGTDFSLRNYSGNFSLDQIETAVSYAHDRGVFVYVACNIYARESDLAGISDYLAALADIGPDALIVADPGIILEAQRIAPHIPLHLSTQANTTNRRAIQFWQNAGISRINAARELSLAEITDCVRQSDIDVEVFVHGAACMAYSGRCLLSSFMAGRDGNRGMCAHPCRWQYYLVESQRPGEYIPVTEDNRGLYLFNTRDICMIAHIPELVRTGVRALKIEGRMKGINYLASAVKVYREALDRYQAAPDTYQTDPAWIEELSHVQHRLYSTGFYYNETEAVDANIENKKPNSVLTFLGKVITPLADNQARVQVRNKISPGMAVNILGVDGPSRTDRVEQLLSDDGTPVEAAQPNTFARIRFHSPVSENDLIRTAAAGS